MEAAFENQEKTKGGIAVPVITDDRTKLAFSVYENKGVFAVLLGSGLSRSAGVPTGWEITQDLIKRVATVQGVEAQTDWVKWYREKTLKEPNYSELLEELASTPAERRSILHSYIEPDDKDREQGKKTATAAHRAIASLVQGGYIRVIVTTNFDRLMENALRERDIEPTIVSTLDGLAGAEPITHSACYILKLHGDYKDARILNTECELNGYPEQYDRQLDRILDEHGLIVCGWSGEWDRALRAAFFRAPNRRYSVFWAARDSLGDGAQELVNHRRACVILISDADRFFSTLQQNVETLEQSQLRNPRSIELLVNSTKRFLAKSEHRIQLDDLITQEANRLIVLLDTGNIARSGWDTADIRAYVMQYEAGTQALAIMCGALGRWGDDSEFPLVFNIVQKLCMYETLVEAGTKFSIPFRLYPAILIFTAYGLGLTHAARYAALHHLLDSPIYCEYKEPRRIVETLFLNAWQGGDNSLWRQIEGLNRHQTALSEHLFRLFSEWGKHFTGFTSDFELVFERFEILASLAYLEQHDKESVGKEMAHDPYDGYKRIPIGRAFRHEYDERLLKELQEKPLQETLVQAGFARDDIGFIDLFVQNFKKQAKKMQW